MSARRSEMIRSGVGGTTTLASLVWATPLGAISRRVSRSPTTNPTAEGARTCDREAGIAPIQFVWFDEVFSDAYTERRHGPRRRAKGPLLLPADLSRLPYAPRAEEVLTRQVICQRR